MPCPVDDPIPFPCKRGATLIVPIEAVGANSADLAGCSIDAGLKAAVGGSSIPAADRPRLLTFAPAERPAANGIGAGWNLALSAQQTLGLVPGTYVTDGLVTLADGLTKVPTEPLLLVVEQMVSA